MITQSQLTPEEFISPAFFPEFASVNRDLIARLLSEASDYCPICTWGRQRANGIRYLTAHWLAMRLYQQGQMAGAAVSAAQGSISEMPQGGKESIYATSYGQRYEEIRRRLPIIGMMV